MCYIISKNDLHESLIEQLVKEVKDKDFSFFTDEMNRIFIEQTNTIRHEYFFDLIEDFLVFEEELYMLEDNKRYETAFNTILKMIEKDFKLRNQ